MKKIFSFVAAALMSATSLFAYDCKVDGIYYNLNSTDLTAEVTFESYGSLSYSGSIVIPSTITYNSQTYSVTTIGESAFESCINLTSITIPNSVTTIGRRAFYGCYDLTSVIIPNSVTTIGDGAFRDCRGLTSVTIPNSVTKIGTAPFSRCTGLTSINVNAANKYYTSVDGVLFNYAKDTLIQYPVGNSRTQYDIPSNVTTIGDDAFYHCINLTSITIPNSVTTIGESAFEDCLGLTSVTIPNSVTTIGKSAFNWCLYLTSITIPNSVTTIGEWAFYNCDELTSITIPNSVITIGSNAFYCCDGLTSVTIGNSVTTIGDDAFNGCYGLTSVTIPNSVTKIGRSAFYGVRNIIYSGSATGAPWGARCLNGVWDGYLLYADNTKTKLCACDPAATGRITIPSSVTTIGEMAFYDCSKLTSITIPNSVTTIGNTIFYNCSGLTSITIPNSVTTIGRRAFSHCSFLTSITIPNSVTMIGDAAFENCFGLTSVTIGNSVTTIGEWAFAWCYGLTSVTCSAENPPICGINCFYDVPKDIRLHIPCVSLSAYQSAEGWQDFTNIITEYFDACGEDLRWKYKDGTLSISGIGEMYDFTQTDSPWLDLKDSVTKIVFPSNITSIGKDAFYGFSKLTSVAIPNFVTTIGDSAFCNCSSLTSITIPNSVKTMGNYAFYNCERISTITLGSGLWEIGNYAFGGDFRIADITCYAEVTPTIYTETFYGITKKNVYLYVPENVIRRYQVDPNWNEFDIRTKSADVTPLNNDKPAVSPTDNDVTITWPINNDAETYTLTITKNGEDVCVLTFNSNGQLINIAFAAPGHNGAHQAPAATLTAQGYQFTVTGLNPGTSYNYSVIATNAGGKTIAKHKGEFSTTGGESSLETVHGSQCTMHKVLRNGQILLERNNATYTLTGQKIK